MGPVKANPPMAVRGISLTVNVTALESPGGFTPPTTMDMGPPCSGVDSSARRKAGMVAVNWLLLTNIVVKKTGPGMIDPFKMTVAPGTKLEPFTVTVRSVGFPSGAEVGVMLEITNGGTA